MRTHCVAQEALLGTLHDLDGKEIQKRRDIGRHIADSLCCTAETKTAL